MTVSWLSHDWIMTVSWLSHDCLMTVSWMSHDCLMNVSWLYHGCLVTVSWLSLDCLLTVSWLSHDCLVTVSQQGKVCWHGVLDCGLGPSLVARTIKNWQLEWTVLKQGAEHQHISLSFRLECLKESEMNVKCKQQHSLSEGALLLALKPSIPVVYFFNGSGNKAKR